MLWSTGPAGNNETKEQRTDNNANFFYFKSRYKPTTIEVSGNIFRHVRVLMVTLQGFNTIPTSHQRLTNKRPSFRNGLFLLELSSTEVPKMSTSLYWQ